ncbi:MAG: polyribonucleotide nucleotidyltransferase [Candidatus Daviesbacteria bacterium]|nr:polyribonucleotide nucleotidyltransferase [Candidatus Daviesbacteria bacterium]
MKQQKTITRELDLNGRKLTLETGYLAQAADAAVLATWGETVILATVAAKPLASDPGYFPLSVEYVEKYYAGGRITAQKFIKRETRPPEDAILAGRAIDRAIRPLFPHDFPYEVQLIVNVLSFDGENDPVTLGFIAAAAAVSLSSVPFAGPMGTVRVGLKDGEFVVNPTLSEYDSLDLNLLVAATKEKVAMIETVADEVEDELVFDGIKKAHTEAQKIVNLIEDFAKEAGKTKVVFSSLNESVEEAVMKEVKTEVKAKIQAALSDPINPWHEATGDIIKQELALKYADTLSSTILRGIFDKVAKELMNDLILNQGKRVDGRAMTDIRPIDIKVGLLPRAHGSAVFQRGSTQVLSIATVGPLSLSQTLEGMMGESTKKFMHHYNMGINPFSVGDVKRIGAPNRRDIGHGALVEKSLVNVIPSNEDFPYAVRVVSEVLAANASTSQAALCASTLALMNAGVKIKNPVAGIALGLLSNEEKFQVITDMQAVEDFYGQMDFKVAGTVKGVTAIQMDTKLHGLSFEIIEEALKQGKAARLVIIEEINKAIPEVGPMSKYAPKIEITHIKPESIGALIGPGGKNINAIIARTGAQIDIEDDGMVMVSSTDDEAIRKAISEIDGMFKEVAVGEVYEGKVVKLATFGAFVEILPGRDGLVHVSQMAPERVENPADIVSEGQTVKVRVTDVDPSGKIGLSMLFGEQIKPDSERRPSGGGNRRDFGGQRREFGNNSSDRRRR